MLLQAAVPDYPSSVEEKAYCARDPQGQTEAMCLADRKYERAQKEMAAALVKARRAVLAQRREIARFKRDKDSPTLEGDPVNALEQSQAAWKKSMDADCLVYGLQFATAYMSTIGVTENWNCKANRILDRARFLRTPAD